VGTLAGPTSPINQIGRWSNQFGCHQLYRPARRRGCPQFWGYVAPVASRYPISKPWAAARLRS